MQASMHKATRGGSYVVLERNLVQHSANIAPKPSKMDAGGGRTEFRAFGLVSFLRAVSARRAQEDTRGVQESPRKFQEWFLGRFEGLGLIW